MTLEDTTSRSTFPIVGIGASAGGLDAFKHFLAELPQQFGFAIVFIQHLLAKQKSLLPDLLRSKKPDIEINEISDGMKILPGRIYLSPPGKEIRIQEGNFHMTARRKAHLCLPIDELFESLAEEAGERSIAVILSGAGTDGARGIQSIRMTGGAIFVQDPETAEFAGMPLAAIKTGQVDGIFSPADIAREILKMQSTIEVSVSASSLISPKDLQTFYRLIREKTGYNFDHYKKTVVARRIRRRMYLHGISSVRDYLQLINEKDSEAYMLASDLMIGVTSFFRDHLAWKALKIEVVRKFVAENDNSQIRVWTPACATGEEAYSIALLLRSELDLAGKKREIQIFATDVNDTALEKARDGTYPASIIVDVPPDYRHKYFTYSEDGLAATISKGMREQVVFARQNLLADPPFSRLDLIICRNLLIYFEPEAQEKCLAIFHYALKEGRYLFLGNAESPGRNSNLFKSIGHKKCRIYVKAEKSPSLRMPLAVPYAAERAASLSPKQAQTSSDRQSIAQFVQDALLEEYAPAAVAFNQNYDIVYHNGHTSRYLRQPRGEPTQNLLELLPKSLLSRIRAAIYKATNETKPVSVRTSISGDDRGKKQVSLSISKLKENLYLVAFREKGVSSEQADAISLEAGEVEETSVRQLEIELSATREALQSNIEQLKSMNEELQSSNEELQAANEELETSREELQSLNEELITVNSQLQSKIEEQEELNNDLNNFLASTSIPTIFLDHKFRLKRFTPAMSRLLKLLPSDVGRPIIDMSQENLGPDLITDAESVLEHLAPIKREIAINSAWYIRTTLPYRTSDNRIEGVVITYNDIAEIKRAEDALRKAMDDLEIRVRERTAELMKVNEELEIEITERRKAEETAKTERQRLYAVLETLPVYVVLLTPDYHVPFANRFFRERFGESHGQRCFEYLFGRTDPCEICETYSALKTMQPHRWEWTGPDSRNYDIYDFPFIDADGATLILEMGIDITEKKQAEKALREINESLERRVAERIAELHKEKTISDSTIESLPGIFYLFDQQGRFLKWNKNYERVSGYSAEELSGMQPLDFFAGEDKRLIEERIQEVYTKGESSVEAQFVSKDGHKTPYFFTGVMTEIDNIKCLIGMGIDISERKRAEEELRESEERFRATYEQAAVGIEHIDLAGHFIRGNGKLSEILGYDEEEIVQYRFSQITHPDDLHIEMPMIEKLIAGKIPNYSIEKRYIHKDGHSVWARVTSSIARTSNPYRISIIEDITKRKQAEEELYKLTEELKRSNADLQQFASVIAHDLQTPLNGIALFTNFLEKHWKGKLDEKADESIHYIIDGVERTKMLIKDLLEYSRLDSKKRAFSPVNCSVALEEAIFNLRSDIEESGIRITYDLLPTVKGDGSQLISLFQNLIGNAIKFRSKETPSIHISAEQKGDEWVFSVRDNGIGIDPKYFEKIFVIFQRLHTSEEYEGTGIGLAICKKIIESHGGRIWVESEPDKGSTFYFTLPTEK